MKKQKPDKATEVRGQNIQATCYGQSKKKP